MSRGLAELTLDEVVAVLIAGEAIDLVNGGALRLEGTDSRALLAFYNRDRSVYWNPDKDAAIREGEIDKLLEALDHPYRAPPLPRAVTQGRQRWRLTKIEAHRFRGLHKHCGAQGRDPEPFVHEVIGDVTLFRGFNGAGKTSLLNAVCWCLTGVGYHAQALPSPPHDLIDVQVEPDDGHADAAPVVFKMPPLVPIPTDEELALLGGEPKIDTWVRLTFRSLDDPTRVVEVQRKLQKASRGKINTPVSGLDDLGLGDLALQAGTTMPAIAAAMRFGDKTSLSQAVATLTGLRPLAAFGARCGRVHDRLIGKFTKAATEERDSAAEDVRKQIITLTDLLEAHPGVPALNMVVVPSLAAPDAWKQGIAEAKQALEGAEAATRADAEALLGALPQFRTDAEIQHFVADIGAANALIVGPALAALPSIAKAKGLGKLLEEDLAAAEAQIDAVLREARHVASSLADKRRADRIRLYSHVAKWHEEHHPGEVIHACPVCGTELLEDAHVPPDALLDMNVAAALESCRTADAAALKTAEEWERDKAREFVTQLPEWLQAFASVALPQTALQLYGTALTTELFGADMPQSLRPLARNVIAIWASAISAAAGMPDARDTSLPEGIPDKEGLRKNLVNIERAIRIARYRAANKEFIQQAMKRTLHDAQGANELGVTQKPLKEQLAVLDSFARSSTAFRAVRGQVGQIEANCRTWALKQERIGKLARAAAALHPFLALPAMVHEQVGGLIETLNSRATWWAGLIYRAQFNGAPSYAGLDPDQADAFTLLAANGKHRVAAHHIMNASALRAFLWSFVLALWEQIWDRSGGISCLLMDDAQDLLDPANVANLAAAVPKMLEAGINPLIASNDFAFLAAVEQHVKAIGGCGAPRVDAYEFSAISRSKAKATMAPLLDDVKECFRRWEADENDPELSRQFAYPVRVRIETKLWDLLGDDPVVLRDPTLGDLMNQISQARRRGELPFNEEPFRKLTEMPCLQSGAPFRDIINKAHHGRADQIAPTDAAIIAEYHDAVLKAIDACWTTYARHMRRLPPESNISPGAGVPVPPAAVVFSNSEFPMLGNLAAHGVGTALADLEAATSSFSLGELGETAFYTLRANTLGMVALQGQTLVVSLSEIPNHGDLVVVQTAGRLYARRLGVDRNDPARVALETLQSTANVPPTHFMMRSASRALKVVGVLFDNVQPDRSQDEAVHATASQALEQVTCVARVSGDSAFPLARDGHHVLLGPAESLSGLAGRIVAVVTQNNPHFPDRQGYLKRLGKPMPGQPVVHYLENVGLFGEGEYVQSPSAELAPLPKIPLIDKIWKVHGVIFR